MIHQRTDTGYEKRSDWNEERGKMREIDSDVESGVPSHMRGDIEKKTTEYTVRCGRRPRGCRRMKMEGGRDDRIKMWVKY